MPALYPQRRLVISVCHDSVGDDEFVEPMLHPALREWADKSPQAMQFAASNGVRIKVHNDDFYDDNQNDGPLGPLVIEE